MRPSFFTTCLTSLLLLVTTTALGSNDSSSTRPSTIVVGAGQGSIASSLDFITREGASSNYKAFSAKYIFTPKSDKWQDFSCRMPYYGVGATYSDLGHHHDIGEPISLYLIQGAPIVDFTDGVSLNYEFNLGVATNWELYNRETNPENVLVSTDVVAHVGINCYIRWYLSQEFDLNIGFAFTHYSNGRWRLPNKGLNNFGAYIETSYNFNRPRLQDMQDRRVIHPEFKRHFRHDLHLLTTSTCLKAKGEGGENNNQRFAVLGIDYFLLRAHSRTFHYGIGAEVIYDESIGSTVMNSVDPSTNKLHSTTTFGDMNDRFSANLVARAEFPMTYYTLFIDMGANVSNSKAEDMRFTQALGIKVYPYKSIFATFGVKAKEFKIANYLYLGIGYTFNAKK